jgi:PAS domain S-box-containing protein
VPEITHWWERTEDLLCVVDRQPRIVVVNPACERALGWTSESLVGRDPLEHVHPDDEQTIGAFLRERHTGTFRDLKGRWRHSDGSWRWLLWSGVRVADGWQCMAKDITDLLHGAEPTISRREQAQNGLLRAMPDGLVVIDENLSLVWVSDVFLEMTGFSREELLGTRPPFAFWPDEHRASIQAAFNSGVAGDTSRLELVLRRKGGELFPAAITACPLFRADGSRCGLLGVFRDVSKEVGEREQLRAARDYERAVHENMGEGLYTVDADGRLVYMNAAAERMIGWRHEDLKGRVLHDIVHPRGQDGSPVAACDCPLLRVTTTGEPVRLDDETFICKNGRELAVKVTSAAFRAEDGRPGFIVVFSDISEHKIKERKLRTKLDRMSWVGPIREALAEDRFVLHAQPIIDLATGQIVQHELLIRMLDSKGVLVAPGHFLPSAEEYELIIDLDRWVIEQAAALAGQGHPVQLNLSAKSIGHPALVPHFARELENTGADPSLIVVELTETALLRNQETADAFVSAIRGLGCKLALDDFGTGYGGFTYLKRMPVDYLKIDMEFVHDVADNLASQSVVSAVVRLASSFGQLTTAEGVEDEPSLILLNELGVDRAQGFHIARPAPVSDVLGSRALKPWRS